MNSLSYYTLCWTSVDIALPVLRSRRHCKICTPTLRSDSVLCALDGGHMQMCFLSYDEDYEEVRWFEDNSECWDVTERVIAWSFISFPSDIGAKQ